MVKHRYEFSSGLYLFEHIEGIPNVYHKVTGTETDKLGSFYYKVKLKRCNFEILTFHGEAESTRYYVKDAEFVFSVLQPNQWKIDGKYLYVLGYSMMHLDGVGVSEDREGKYLKGCDGEDRKDLAEIAGENVNVLVVPISNLSFFEVEFDLKSLIAQEWPEEFKVEKENILTLMKS